MGYDSGRNGGPVKKCMRRVSFGLSKQKIKVVETLVVLNNEKYIVIDVAGEHKEGYRIYRGAYNKRDRKYEDTMGITEEQENC